MSPSAWCLRLGLCALTALPSELVAQAGIFLRADSSRRVVAPSGKLAIPVRLDMSTAIDAVLTDVTTGVTFDAGLLTFDSVRTAGFGLLTTTTTNAAAGSLTLGVHDASGTAVTQTLATMYFTASASTGGTKMVFRPTAAATTTVIDAVSWLRRGGLDVCVAPRATWGDVNGDSVSSPLGDGNVNIIDAQQIARYSVALTVTNRPAIVTRGDVNADGNVNIIDAQQLARYTVGLSASARVYTTTFAPPPAASVSLLPGTVRTLDAGGAVQLVPTVRDASNADVTACATVTWTSNNPSVATVTSSGSVRAIAVGATNITATSNGQAAMVTITVVPATLAYSQWYPDSADVCFWGHMCEGIFLMDADGTNRRRITQRGQGQRIFPVWSPDGFRLAYSAGDSTPRIVNADGSGETRVPSGIGTVLGGADWSPDGSKFTSLGRVGEWVGIAVFTVDGSVFKLVADSVYCPSSCEVAGNPRWSPDGQRIAYNYDSITIVTSDGSAPSLLSSGYYPAWSPDGTRIAFTRGWPWHGFELFTMNADGTEVQRITWTPQFGDEFNLNHAMQPVWSPDGTRIAFSQVRYEFLPSPGHGTNLYTIGVDGSDLRRITTNSNEENYFMMPAWRPRAHP